MYVGLLRLVCAVYTFTLPVDFVGLRFTFDYGYVGLYIFWLRLFTFDFVTVHGLGYFGYVCLRFAYTFARFTLLRYTRVYVCYPLVLYGLLVIYVCLRLLLFYVLFGIYLRSTLRSRLPLVDLLDLLF